MSKNDDLILSLKEKIEAQKKKVGPVKRMVPITSCSILLDGPRYNLHTMSRDDLIFLACKLQALDTAANDLGYSDQCMISGFTTSDWLTDIKCKLDIIAQKGELEKLKTMEEKLNKLLSDDKKTELEIAEIAAILGG